MSATIVFYAAFAAGIVSGLYRLAMRRDEPHTAAMPPVPPPAPTRLVPLVDPEAAARHAYITGRITLTEFETQIDQILRSQPDW